MDSLAARFIEAYQASDPATRALMARAVLREARRTRKRAKAASKGSAARPGLLGQAPQLRAPAQELPR